MSESYKNVSQATLELINSSNRRRRTQFDIKQSDTKQSDTKQSDTKQSDTKQSDTKQSDTKQSDIKQSEQDDYVNLSICNEILASVDIDDTTYNEFTNKIGIPHINSDTLYETDDSKYMKYLDEDIIKQINNFLLALRSSEESNDSSSIVIKPLDKISCSDSSSIVIKPLDKISCSDSSSIVIKPLDKISCSDLSCDVLPPLDESNRLSNDPQLNNNDSDEKTCCVCYLDLDNDNKLYLLCGHKLCIHCYNKLSENNIKINVKNKKNNNPFRKVNEIVVMKKLCPICRRSIDQIMMNKYNKYAIICLGESTTLHTFQNGGYKSIHIYLYPENKWISYYDITYETDSKDAFELCLYDLYDKNYMLIAQDYNEICYWLKEVYLTGLLDRFNDRLLKF
jgi:hypothetical protein